jgi:hypothetical protein
MTKGSHWLGASALACFAALSACGSKGGQGGGSGNGQGVPGSAASACLGQFTGGACGSCIESSCASALGAFANDCSDYIACYCPNGQYSASAQTTQGCVSKITTNPSCLTSAQGINTCMQQSCDTACLSTGGGSGSGGGSGGSGGDGGSGSGASVAACGIAFTGAACASCVMTKCCSVTQTCAQDQACIAIITCIHQCASSMSCEEGCIANASKTAQSELDAAGSCWASQCSGACQ